MEPPVAPPLEKKISQEKYLSPNERRRVNFETFYGAPQTLQACLEQAQLLNRPGPNDGVVSMVKIDIERYLDIRTCYDRFGRFRQDEMDRALAVQKVDRPHRATDCDDRSGYEKSIVHGGAHWVVRDYDYGTTGCRMPGGLYSAC